MQICSVPLSKICNRCIKHLVIRNKIQFHVKQTITCTRKCFGTKKLLINRNVTISNCIRMLILIKNNEQESLSKQKLGKLLGVSSSSVQIWRKAQK